MTFLMILLTFVANAFQIKVLDHKNVYLEGDFFDSQVEIISNNTSDLSKFLSMIQVQVHPNLYLVSSRLKENEPIATFIATSDRKTEENLSVILQGELKVNPVEKKEFEYKEISHNLFKLPKFVLILIGIFLVGIMWMLPKWFRKHTLKKEFIKSQQRHLSEIKILKHRHDFENFYAQLKILDEFFEWRESLKVDFQNRMNEIQYKNSWSSEELLEIQNLHSRLASQIRLKKYGT